MLFKYLGQNVAEFQEKTLTLSIYVVYKIWSSLVIKQTTIQNFKIDNILLTVSFLSSSG